MRATPGARSSRPPALGALEAVPQPLPEPGHAEGVARALGREPPETFQERARGSPAMADRVLLGGRELGHRPPVLIVVGHESGVVAEAALPSGLVRQGSLAAALDDLLGAARLYVGEYAHIGDAPVAVGRHLAQQLRQVLLVRCAVARVAGRPHARRAAERL